MKYNKTLMCIYKNRNLRDVCNFLAFLFSLHETLSKKNQWIQESQTGEDTQNHTRHSFKTGKAPEGKIPVAQFGRSSWCRQELQGMLLT